MIRRALVAALASAIPGLAIADPVTVIALGAQLAASGALGAALTISAATAAWIGVGAAVFGMAQARNQQRKAAAAARQAAAAALEDRTTRAATNTPPRVTIYGRALTSGYPVDVFATDGQHIMPDGSVRTVPDCLRHVVVVWSGRACAGINGLRFENDTILSSEFGPDGWALPGSKFYHTRQDRREITLSPGTHTLPVVADSIVAAVSRGRDNDDESVAYTLASDGRAITIHGATKARVTYLTTVAFSWLRASHHLGDPNQTVDAYLASVAPTRYTSAHRLRGLTYSVITYDLRHERWQSGLPTPVADILGALVYDPRAGLTGWSVNPALCVLDYLLSDDGFGAELEDIDLPSVIAAANACDRQITSPVGTGTVSRYTCNGVADTSSSRESVLDDLCRAMAGNAVYSGIWRLSAGAYSPPVVDLTDDDLAGSISIVQAGAPDDQITNGVRGVYIPSGGVTAVDMEPYQDATLLTADGGRERWQSVDLPYTDASWRCRNVGRVMMETARNGLVISYPGKLHLLRLQPGDRVRVTAKEGSYSLFSSKVFRVTDSALAPRGVAQLTLQEDDPAAWDEVAVSAADTTPNTSLPDPWTLAPVQSLAASSGNAELIVQTDGTIVPRIRVAWTIAADSPAETAVIKWTRASGGETTTITAPADQLGAYLTGVADGQIINIEAYLLSRLARSDSRYLSHTVIGKTEPPPDVLSMSVQELAGLGRNFVWQYPSPPADLAGFTARYSAHTAGQPLPAWSAMTPLFEAPANAINYDATAKPPDGEWAFAIRAVDTSGNESTAAAYTTALFTAGGLGSPIATIKPESLGWPGTRIDCIVDGSFLVAAEASVPWSALPSTWGAWTSWSAGYAATIAYQHTDIDIGSSLSVYLRTDALSNGATIVTQYQMSTDGTTWTAWANIPTGRVTGRYFRVRWTLSGVYYATFYRATFTIYG